MQIKNHYDWGYSDGRLMGAIAGVVVGILLGLWIAHSPYICHF